MPSCKIYYKLDLNNDKKLNINMKNTVISAIALAACLLAAAACDKKTPVDPGKPTERKDILLTRAQQEYVRESNEFAFRLYDAVAAENCGFIISPLSVTYALGMVANGAVGQTRDEIIDVLGFSNGSSEEINAFCKTMMAQSSQLDPAVALETANLAVADKGNVPLKDKFVKDIESGYEAKVVNMNFATEDVRGFINKWGSEKTHGMIPQILDDPLSPESFAHFLNAIYFKGSWTSRFNRKETRKEAFRKEDGFDVSVNMMHQQADFEVGENAIFQTLRLPYGNQAFRMVVLLPKPGKSLRDIAAFLNPVSWEEMLSALFAAKVDVKLPAFETAFKIEYKDILVKLGMPTAFGPAADFSAMADARLSIAQVLQKAKIKVDEEGAEAAAVTDVEIRYNSSGSGQKVNFHADHPFLYAITEISTGAIFFIGQYTGE